MKKNKMMRVASILLVAVLLTTSIISGTFAKYVTSGEAADHARVAKFGVLVSAEGKLFDKTYFTEANTPGGKDADTTPFTELSVESSNGDKLVAPGTQSEEDGLTFGITGIPEVDVNIQLDFSAVEDVFLKSAEGLPDMTKADYAGTFNFEDDNDYYPIVFTLAGDYIAARVEEDGEIFDEIEGLTYDDGEESSATPSVSGTLADIVAAIAALNNDGDGIFVDANTDLSDVENGGIGEFVLTWAWAFEDEAAADIADLEEAVTQAQEALDQAQAQEPAGDTSDLESALADAQEELEEAQAAVLLRDQKDTLLGDLAALKADELESSNADDALEALEEGMDKDYNLDVDVALTITVTQID